MLHVCTASRHGACLTSLKMPGQAAMMVSRTSAKHSRSSDMDITFSTKLHPSDNNPYTFPRLGLHNETDTGCTPPPSTQRHPSLSFGCLRTSTALSLPVSLGQACVMMTKAQLMSPVQATLQHRNQTFCDSPHCRHRFAGPTVSLPRSIRSVATPAHRSQPHGQAHL